MKFTLFLSLLYMIDPIPLKGFDTYEECISFANDLRLANKDIILVCLESQDDNKVSESELKQG